MLVAAHGAVLAMAATLTHAATPGTAFATSEASPMGHRLLQVASADDTGSGLHAYTDGHDGPADAVALQQAHSVGSGGASRRKLLHGCHGQKRCGAAFSRAAAFMLYIKVAKPALVEQYHWR